MSNILVVAEHANGKLNASTARAVNCASKIGGNITVLVLGAAPEGAAAEAAQIAGVTAVQSISNPANDTPVSAILAPQIAAAAAGFSHVLGPNTTFGKDLMPRVAALLGVGQVTDISAVHGARRFERPIYAGNAVTTIDVPGDGMVVGTVRCASWAAAGQGGSAAVSAITVNATIPSHTRYKGLQAGGGDRPDLQSASRVVSGGRGVGSGENFKVIFSLADKLGAGVGASRAAVDAGYVPNDMQVGQTGKIIAPELYVAVGISGAIQHLAGIKDAGTIVAINSDPEAPIFEVADIGLVGDLFQLLPALESALS